MKSIEGISYGRLEPPEWAGLAQFTQDLLDDEQLSHESRVRTLSERVAPLDDETLDENRYYGLGLIMCGLMRAMQPPEVQDRLIENLAESLVADHVGRHGQPRNRRGLDVGKVRSRYINKPFEELVDSTARALPPATRLLTNGLQADAGHRILRIQYPEIDRPDDFYQRMADDPGVSQIRGTVADAASLVFDLAAGRRKGYLMFNVRDKELPNLLDDTYGMGYRHTATDVMAEPDKIPLTKLARAGATLRFDEFLNTFRKLLELDGEGCVIFNRNDVPDPGKLRPSPELLHVKRLMCPALHVKDLIPTMMHIIPTAVMRADKRIADSYNHA